MFDKKAGETVRPNPNSAAVWVYTGEDTDGDAAVFDLSAQQNLLAENSMGDSVYSTPTAAGKVLFISTRSRLFAISALDAN